VAALRTVLGVLTLIVVPPVLLWVIFGNPVELLPSWHAVTGFLSGLWSGPSPRDGCATVLDVLASAGG
jgi:hypothetical protein